MRITVQLPLFYSILCQSKKQISAYAIQRVIISIISLINQCCCRYSIGRTDVEYFNAHTKVVWNRVKDVTGILKPSDFCTLLILHNSSADCEMVGDVQYIFMCKIYVLYCLMLIKCCCYLFCVSAYFC